MLFWAGSDIIVKVSRSWLYSFHYQGVYGEEGEPICYKMYQEMVQSSSRWGGDTAAAPGDTEGDRPELGLEEPWLG